MKASIDIFSGFLGAGKTTLIKKLIDEELYKEKIIIIENEFGEVGIDGSFLKKSNIEIKEINAGCICCTVSGDFNKAISEVIKMYNPERIIIEPSGVAKLSEILSVCRSQEIRDIAEVSMIITLVDALKFDMYLSNFSEFYKNQITNAKTIILSRTQNTTSDKVLKIVDKIQLINNKANIVTTPWDRLKSQKIFEASKEELKSLMLEQINLVRSPLNSVILKARTNHLANEVFQTYGIETPKIFSKERLIWILNEIKNSKMYGNVLRAKGIVQASGSDWMQFDYVPEEKEIRSSIPDYTSRICIIGTNLNKENLKKLF